MSSVTREVRIDAPTRTVWRHISDPDARRRWLGGDLDVDLSPGQHGTFATPDDDRPVRIDDVDRGRSVTFTWGEDGDASEVTIEVAPDGEGSRVRVTEATEEAQQPVTPPAGDELPAGTEPLAYAA